MNCAAFEQLRKARVAIEDLRALVDLVVLRIRRCAHTRIAIRRSDRSGDPPRSSGTSSTS